MSFSGNVVPLGLPLGFSGAFVHEAQRYARQGMDVILVRSPGRSWVSPQALCMPRWSSQRRTSDYPASSPNTLLFLAVDFGGGRVGSDQT